MPFDRLLVGALRVALLFGCTLAAMPLLRRSTSATRRLWLALALGGALVLPLVSAIAPAWRMEAPAAMTSLRAVAVSEPLVQAGDATEGPSPHPGPARVRSRGGALDPFPVEGLLLSVWALGAILVLARLGVGLMWTRGIVRRSTEAPSWSAAVARAARVTHGKVGVRMTHELPAPAVTGMFRPLILVPAASGSWSDGRRHAVLLHELAHVAQRDCLVHVVAQLACAAHWFDPLAWLVVRRLRVERELAADDAVIAAGARASSYAEDLLAIAGAGELTRATPSGALGMADRAHLVARVKAIVSPERARLPLTRLRATLLALGFAAGVTAMACATPAVPATPATVAAPSARALPVAVVSGGSTLDPRLQAIADEELARALGEWQAVAGTVLVMDPSTGEILADAGRAHGAPADVAVRSAYVTGSTLKAVTLAAALEEGVVSPTESFDCEHGSWRYGGKVVQDHDSYGTLTVSEMLAVSSNIGFAKVFDRLGGSRLSRWLRAFHFGVAPPLEGANTGWMPERIEDQSFQGAVAAIGETITASPLQVAAAYAALANGGVYVSPTLSRRAGRVHGEALLRPETARTVVSMLEGAVNGERATGTRARIPGARVAGKTGTAAWDLPGGGEGRYASFVGFVPSSAPRFVILVGLEQPQNDGNGPEAAAPVFARVASRALAP